MTESLAAVHLSAADPAIIGLTWLLTQICARYLPTTTTGFPVRKLIPYLAVFIAAVLQIGNTALVTGDPLTWGLAWNIALAAAAAVGSHNFGSNTKGLLAALAAARAGSPAPADTVSDPGPATEPVTDHDWRVDE